MTMKLLNFLGLKKPMVSYDEHALQKGEGILRRIEAGENCALCSDAGMPCVSDPGEVIVRDALARGCLLYTSIGKLEAIEAATGGNTAGNTEYHDTLARLSALVPSLADDIDRETDSSKGGTEALRQHTDAYVADSKAQSRQD